MQVQDQLLVLESPLVSIITTCQRSCSLHVRLIVQLVLFFELHCSLSKYIYIYVCVCVCEERDIFFFQQNYVRDTIVCENPTAAWRTTASDANMEATAIQLQNLSTLGLSWIVYELQALRNAIREQIRNTLYIIGRPMKKTRNGLLPTISCERRIERVTLVQEMKMIEYMRQVMVFGSPSFPGW